MCYVETLGRTLLLSVHQDLDESGIAKFERLLDTLSVDGFERVEIDLRDCGYMGARGISALIRTAGRCDAHFAVSILPAGCVYRLFEVCGFIDSASFIVVRERGDSNHTSIAS